MFEQYPFVMVIGPRQSGKATLCRSGFAHLDYANLEAPHIRECAEADPLMERLAITHALALDADFRIYRYGLDRSQAFVVRP
ncbi:MAG: hypothetical protein OXG67_09550 [bacterium]|nr:hypothetical protein [bacterium]MCY3889405.1 hypothetical protein [bacterium]